MVSHAAENRWGEAPGGTLFIATPSMEAPYPEAGKAPCPCGPWGLHRGEVSCL